MIAQLFLVVHHAEVVVVTSAEHTVRHHLILAFPTVYHPEGSSARLEPIVRDLSRLDYCESLRKTFLEDFRQNSLLLFGEEMGPAQLLRDLPQNAVFGWFTCRQSSLVHQILAYDRVSNSTLERIGKADTSKNTEWNIPRRIDSTPSAATAFRYSTVFEIVPEALALRRLLWN